MARTTLRSWLEEGPFSLAMSSGFFGFFAHCGLVRVLEEEGLFPEKVAGSSAGALVGGLWASGLRASEMSDELRRLKRDTFWDPSPGVGLLRGQKFREHLERLLPSPTFEGCRFSLRVSVFDWLSQDTRVLDRGPLAPALHASCAVPLLFHPVWHEGRLYADGGILDRPGLMGIPAGERVLFHHLVSRSPWRRVDPTLRIPSRENLRVLILHGLPRSGPFRLEEGRRAMNMAYEAARRALDTEFTGSRVELTA
ncbi:MAG: patatin-like phospholipase family protein [Myxococcales bacterium]|nr:patatin-like phospholipase family protein [Polyangiaceae bacterium]MDW8249667.1 patatin-like phospholipase family protein [Myxococcales bacterium]